MGISVSPGMNGFRQSLSVNPENLQLQALSNPEAPVAAIKNRYNLPEVVPYSEGPPHVTDSGASLVLEGELGYRRAVACRYGIDNTGSDKELVGKALESCLSRYPSFSAAFRSLLASLNGEFSLIVTNSEHIYAGYGLGARNSSLLIGQNGEGLQAVSSDPRGLYRCGAEEISELEPHQLVQLGSGVCNIVNWTFPARPNR